MRKVAWLLVVCMVMTLSACSGGGAAGQGSTEPAISPAAESAEPSAAPEPTPEATPEPTPKATPEPAKSGNGVGDTIEVEGVLITLTAVEESEGTQLCAPDEGNVFLLCYFNIENNSDEELTVSTMLSFETYVDDYSTSLSLSALLAADGKQLDGTIAAGKKMAGVVGYEVPADWSTLEITFTPNVWIGKSATFIAEK